MRLIALVVLTAIAAPAGAETLHVSATAGMLQEWELTADLATSASGPEYSGPAVLRHVGLCSADGPEQKTGELKMRPARFSARLEATLSYEGHVCAFAASRRGSASGVMDCRDGGAIPITVSVH